ncbi:hypothetical protein PT974_07652 [Cladobotryum mycophilum]|uniref:P-loop containing nucleoside triphosphate hydrolase protein n=1 Tax=Cladobotryum mycophilum TaxID=491253 RepID=A0ABR0SPV0_9HYPO
MDHAAEEPRPQREMKVLALGLPRSGSASLAAALTILGYKDVYHALQAFDRPDTWEFFNCAADASYPSLPTYTGHAFTRQDWDELFGSCEVTTDAGAMFAPQMIKTYPDAKVILTIREFGKWYKSIDDAFFRQLWSLPAQITMNFVEPLLGTVGAVACTKMLLGFFEATSLEEVRKNAWKTYDRHNRQVQELVAPDQLLIYKMGEGWGPLCEFLGKPVPDVEFPWVNETEEFKARVAKQIKDLFLQAVKVLLPWTIGISAIGIGSWLMGTKYDYKFDLSRFMLSK